MFHIVLLINFKGFLYKKTKTKTPCLVPTMASLTKTAEKVIKSRRAELPGSFTEYS